MHGRLFLACMIDFIRIINMQTGIVKWFNGKVLDLSRRTMKALIYSRTFQRLTWMASKPSRTVRKFSSRSCKVRRVCKLRTSRHSELAINHVLLASRNCSAMGRKRLRRRADSSEGPNVQTRCASASAACCHVKSSAVVRVQELRHRCVSVELPEHKVLGGGTFGGEGQSCYR